MNRLVFVLLIVFMTPAVAKEVSKAHFAGGCFWCMEAAYQGRDGIVDVVSGFTGGTLKNPIYSGNHKGHFEAVEVRYDPARISYRELVNLFWVNIDPFDDSGQFCDKGFSYRSALFPANAEEWAIAEQSLADIEARFPDQKVYTEIRDASSFWPVDDSHQDYYLNNPVRYKYYRWGCGRDKRLDDIWGSEARDGAAEH